MIIIQNTVGITKNSIYEDLLALGINKGDSLLVHSAFESIGNITGGPDALIYALMDAVGYQGLIVLPTFTYSYVGWVEQGKSVPFNKSKSPVKDKVADAFWRKKDVHRSDHPARSVAAWGRDAKNLVQDHGYDTYEFEKGTPLHKLAMQGGKVLLIGVDQDQNSMIHIAETLAGLSFMEVDLNDDRGKEYLLEDNDGKIYSVPVPEKSVGCSREFVKLNTEFERQKIIRYGKVGNAEAKLMNAVEMIDVVVKILKQDPEFLLCDANSDCKYCNIRREYIKKRRRK